LSFADNNLSVEFIGNWDRLSNANDPEGLRGHRTGILKAEELPKKEVEARSRSSSKLRTGLSTASTSITSCDADSIAILDTKGRIEP